MSLTDPAPVYIVSKGRHDPKHALTVRALTRMAVPFHVVCEEPELGAYSALLDGTPGSPLVLPPMFKEAYELCDDLGLSRSTGPGPARNFAWDHARRSGSKWHWVMDDNIDGFYRLNRNLKTPVADGTVLRVMEDFADRYENVAMAGPNYFMFASRKTRMPPFVMNTRIYSCNLIRNDVLFRWRGRYNEDTILSLDMLKAGWVTIQYNAFLQMKATTQTLPGGNTAEFYAAEGTGPKSEMLARVHPDVARVAERFGRIHHQVDYGVFKQTLKRREGLTIQPGVDDYGMILEQEVDGRWVRIDDPLNPRIIEPEASGWEDLDSLWEAS